MNGSSSIRNGKAREGLRGPLARGAGRSLARRRADAAGLAPATPAPRAPPAAPLDRANFTGLVLDCIEAKCCK